MLKIVQQGLPTSKSHQEICQKSFDQVMQRQDIGFFKMGERISFWQQSYDLGEDLRCRFDHLAIVGLGGSSLGTRVISDVFKVSNLCFVDNVDATEFEETLESLGDLKKTCWAFISKSGTTIETLCTLEFLDQIYRQEGLQLSEHAVVISENRDNTLTRWAQQNKVPQAEIPLDVGGRFSVLTPVGMVPAAFAGLDLEKFRVGSLRALAERELIANIAAQALASFEREEWITLLWSYNSKLKSFGGWFQQLWAESLAKQKNIQGKAAPRVSTPMTAVGACDQHSILQQVMEGARDKWVVFQRIGDSELGSQRLQKSQFKETQDLEGRSMGELLKAEGVATQEALSQNGVSTLSLYLEHLDEESLGYLFMFWEMVVATIGETLAINTFDQPGVELGKRLAKDKLKKA